MDQLQNSIERICQRYKARVIQIRTIDDYYLVETNRGPKELRAWPRVDVMRWSFAWREQVARQGFRDVERFIRTRDAKPYVVSGRWGYTLTDHVRQQEGLFPSLEQMGACGQIVAWMHNAQLTQRLPIAVELFNKEVTLLALEEKRASELARELEGQLNRLTDQELWVASQFYPLLQRMRKSVELLGTAILDESLLAVSHRSLGTDNFCLLDGRIFLRGFYRPALSVQQRDTSAFIRELFLASASTEAIDAFLDGYEGQKHFAYQDYLLLLGFLAFPGEPWKKIEQYFTQPRGLPTEAAVLQIENALRDQQSLDELLQHLAKRAEQVGRGNLYEPI